MPDIKVGQRVTFHTTTGPRAAIVCGHGEQGDNDTFLAVFRGPDDDGSDSGLTGDINYRWSHEDGQAGGFTS